MNPQFEVESILLLHRAKLIRHKKHEVWRFPDGRTFVQACTPSDFRASHNTLRDLRRMLGLGADRGQVGQRRERKDRPGANRPSGITASASGAMLEAMRKSGLVEDTLNARIAILKLELRNSRRANSSRRKELHRVNKHCNTCWGCRLARWVKRIKSRIQEWGG